MRSWTGDPGRHSQGRPSALACRRWSPPVGSRATGGEARSGPRARRKAGKVDTLRHSRRRTAQPSHSIRTFAGHSGLGCRRGHAVLWEGSPDCTRATPCRAPRAFPYVLFYVTTSVFEKKKRGQIGERFDEKREPGRGRRGNLATRDRAGNLNHRDTEARRRKTEKHPKMDHIPSFFIVLPCLFFSVPGVSVVPTCSGVTTTLPL
jgi:hypothetical protein